MLRWSASLLWSLSVGIGSSPSAQAAPPVVDACAAADYLDRTAASADRQFAWDFPFAVDPERCIRVQVGQSVQWVGNFADHPLQADEGDANNPIGGVGADGVVTFTQVGTFGYRCNFHFAMRGAIQVVAAPAPPSVTWGTPGAVVAAALSLLVVGALAVRRRESRSRR